MAGLLLTPSSHLRHRITGVPYTGDAWIMDPLIIGFIVFALILAGAFAGWAIRQCLPAHHLSDETKSLVSVSMAVVATVSALVLGLLTSNANTSFRALGGEVTTLSAQILRLDQILRRYGPDRIQTQLGRCCDSMPKTRLPIYSPTIRHMFALTIRRHTNCSSSSRICCLP